MAAMTLTVTPSELTKTANAFDASRNKCVRLATQIMNVADTLKGSWEGEAASAFYRKLKAIHGDIKDINKMIDEHVQDLREIANVYTQTEDTVKGQSSGLQTDVLHY